MAVDTLTTEAADPITTDADDPLTTEDISTVILDPGAGFTTSPPRLDATLGFGSATYGFSATAVTTASPVLGTPAAGSVVVTVALGAAPIRVGADVGVTGLIIGGFAFTAQPLTTGAPVIGRPIITTTGFADIRGLELATASPEIGSPLVKQRQLLGASGLVMGSPGLGRPILGGPNIPATLVAVSLFTESLELGRPAIGTVTALKPAFAQPFQLPAPPVIGPPERDRHIRRNGDDYIEPLLDLVPQGRAWPREPERWLYKTVSGLAQICGYVDGRAADLLERESDPRLTIELLTDWERNWGLPDPCFFGEPTTVSERHRMLLMKMTLLGAQSREFFIWAARQLGYDITISEFSPFMAGYSHVGDTRAKDTTDDLFTAPYSIFGP
jgi:uncharacterized protein YmfQ (DUF2313 family)